MRVRASHGTLNSSEGIMSLIVSHSCPDCTRIGGHCKMELMHTAISENCVHVRLKCPVCSCTMRFRSDLVDTEYGDDGWSHEYGSHEPLILQMAEEAARKRFWNNYRELRAMSPEKLNEIRARRNWRRMSDDYTAAVLREHANPVLFLDKYIGGTE